VLARHHKKAIVTPYLHKLFDLRGNNTWRKQ
jgi:hypothetical protein